jgi:hypothetical protein
MSQPDQHHPAQQYYQPQDHVRPKSLSVTAWLAVATAAGVTISSIIDAVLVREALQDTAITEPGTAIYALNAILYLVLLVGAYVVTCIWLMRARDNSRLMAPGFEHTRRSGWIWGGWVCPIVNFWFPFQVVRDVYDPPSRRASTIMGFWWTAWIVLLVASRVSDGLALDAVTDSEIDTAASASVFLAVVTVVALALWALVVRQVTRRQHQVLGLG